MAAVLITAATTASAGDQLEVGASAPGFTLRSDDGQEVSLADAAGKIVVLEWINPDCPFVQRHYRVGTMKKLAKRYAGKGVVWIAINSTHYMTVDDDRAFRDKLELPYPILDDHEGTVGRRYGAATTPHIFIVDDKGTLVYQGAVDDDPRGGKGKDATSFVANALDSLLAGRPIATARTKPYGCTVKYKK